MGTKEQTATHEAGHAVLITATGGRVRSVVIHAVFSDGIELDLYDGKVEPEYETALAWVRTPGTTLLTDLAGYAAESAFGFECVALDEMISESEAQLEMFECECEETDPLARARLLVEEVDMDIHSARTAALELGGDQYETIGAAWDRLLEFYRRPDVRSVMQRLVSLIAEHPGEWVLAEHAYGSAGKPAPPESAQLSALLREVPSLTVEAADK